MAVIDEYGVNQPANEVPADGAVAQGVTPLLVASDYDTSLVVQEEVDPGNLDMTVSLRLSRDGFRYGNAVPRSLGVYGHYEHYLNWQLPGGLGRYESFAAIHLHTNAPVEFAPDSMMADIQNANR